ncbi:MAG: SpoIIE family protein phosphatase [Desulfobacteraceae bacterium]|nr:SpoIIE family protein phosphatase [Desulfobacteraceae bacterium]
MNEDRFVQEFCSDNFIKAAQYFSGMPVDADIYEEAVCLITRLFQTDLTFFAVRGSDGVLNISNVCFKEKEFSPGLSEQDKDEQQEKCKQILSQSEEFIEQVFETEFLAFENIELNEGMHTVVFLPIVRSNKAVSVLAVGYNDNKPIPVGILNIYLGIAGLISSMFEKQVSHHRFQVLADNVPEMLFRLMIYPDRRASFIYVSKGSGKILGLSPDILMHDASCFFDRIWADDRLAFYRSAFKSLKKKSRLSIFFRWKDDSGNIRHILTNAVPVMTEDGAYIWDGTAQDITEAKTAEFKIRKLNEELRERADELSKANIEIKELNLDLASIIKTSQTISGEIETSHLMKKLMKIVIENAGAQKGSLIFNENGNLIVAVQSDTEKNETLLQSVPVSELKEKIAASVIDFGARTKDTVLLNDALLDDRFSDDPYIVRFKPKSVLCYPIIHKGELTAFIYLENNISAGAFTQNRLEVLNVLSSQAAISLENARLYANIEAVTREKTRISTEMEIAKQIQTSLFPEKPAIKGYEISVYMEPADEVGGDYYDVIRSDGRDWIVIGDVSGHGVHSGLVMMMTQTAIHVTLSQNKDINPSDLLTVINKTISENISRMGEDKHISITVLRTGENGLLTFSGLHEDILIYRAESDTVEALETDGVYIGLTDDIKGMLEDDVLRLNTGDVLLLYTDGITESWLKGSDYEEMFGQDRLTDIFRRLGNCSSEEIKNGILDSMQNYNCEDDVAMMVIKRKNESF